MAIDKAEILTFVNVKLHVTETDIDTEIQEVLDDLSEENLLTATTGEGSIAAATDLAAGSTTIAQPDLYKQLVDITLNDGSVERRPLVALPGGIVDLRRLIGQSASQGRPEWYVEFNNLFYIYPISNGVYTPTIEFYKFHAGADDESGPDDIEFGDEFTRVLKYGTAFNVAVRKRMGEQMTIWGQRYQRMRDQRIENRTEQAYIVGSANDFDYPRR